MDSQRHARIPANILARAFACVALLFACTAPARYVVVTNERDWEQLNVSQRPIWLSRAEAQANWSILGLKDRSMVAEYGRTRSGGSPLEKLLHSLVTGRYDTAEQILNTRPSEIPDYLRLVIAADLAYERSLPDSTLLKMYQEAYDAQDNDLARSIIDLRIRQVRYRQ